MKSKISTILRMNTTTSLLLLASLVFFQACQNNNTDLPENTIKRPNILIAISDDQSYPYTSIYGDKSTQTRTHSSV